MPEDETSYAITDEMGKKAREINYSPSNRTMDRHTTEVKVSSVLDGGLSVTKAGIKKDMCICTSENALRNVLNYAAAALPAHFMLDRELEKMSATI